MYHFINLTFGASRQKIAQLLIILIKNAFKLRSS